MDLCLSSPGTHIGKNIRIKKFNEKPTCGKATIKVVETRDKIKLFLIFLLLIKIN